MLPVAIEIAKEAGDLALRLRGSVSHADKSDGTWVTEADRATEELIRDRLGAHFPDHRAYGEEMGGSDDLSEGCCWLIDPIDGTTNYVNGLPIWAVSLGLLRDGVPALGVVYLPMADELFAAETGGGARLNGETLRPDQRGVMDRNTLVACNSDALDALEIDLPVLRRNLGSTAAHACYVASGGVTAALFDGWYTWDIAAALCVAFEAGAVAHYVTGERLTDFAGVPADLRGEAIVIGPEFAVNAVLPQVRNKAAARP